MHPLQYDSRTAPARSPRSAGEWALVVINSVAAAASLLLVPLTAHIFGCDEGNKWCHLQALALGGPLSLGVAFLTAITLSKLPAAKAQPLHRGGPLFGPLIISVAVLVLLWTAVAINSR